MSRTSHHEKSAHDTAASCEATASSSPPTSEETPLLPLTGRLYESPLTNFQRRHAAIIAAVLALAALAGLALVRARGDATVPLDVASPNLGGHHHHDKSHENSYPQRVADVSQPNTEQQQHMNDNVPIYYAAPAGAHKGKVSMLCLSPKVWSTSMGLLLLAGYHPAEIENTLGQSSTNPAVVAKYRDGFNGVAAAHDALTLPLPARSHHALDKKDQYFLTRDPLDRLYSGYSGKILCDNKGVDADECECDYVMKYLEAMFFDSDQDSVSKEEMSESFESLKADWHRRNLCSEPNFGGFVDWLDHAFTKSPAFTKQRVKRVGDSWFNHFVPQTWLGCGFDIESELTILKTEEESKWYPSFIDHFGLKYAHKLDGETWGRIPGGAEPQPCFYQCGSLSCDEMVGGNCPYEPPAGRKYSEMYTPELKEQACRIFADDLAVLGYEC